MPVLLWIALGAVPGAWLRYAASSSLPTLPGHFPWATLGVNLLGGLLVGLFFGVRGSALAFDHPDRLLVVVGFLGGLTTFSTYSFETVQLLRQGQVAVALLYVLASNLGCLALAYAGLRLGA
jgi:CrcB protein